MHPPIIEGGQGRSPRDVREDGAALAFTLLGLVCLVIALVAKGCAA